MHLEALLAEKVPTARKAKAQITFDDPNGVRAIALLVRIVLVQAIVVLKAPMALVAMQPGERLGCFLVVRHLCVVHCGRGRHRTIDSCGCLFYSKQQQGKRKNSHSN